MTYFVPATEPCHCPFSCPPRPADGVLTKQVRTLPSAPARELAWGSTGSRCQRQDLMQILRLPPLPPPAANPWWGSTIAFRWQCTVGPTLKLEAPRGQGLATCLLCGNLDTFRAF